MKRIQQLKCTNASLFNDLNSLTIDRKFDLMTEATYVIVFLNKSFANVLVV